MQSTWPASVPLLLVLLALLAPCPSSGQQVGYQYVQSAADGEGAIFLNLWGVLGGCGGGTLDELYVQFVSGSVLGEYTVAPIQQDDLLAVLAPSRSDCVRLTGRTLDSSGLGPLYVLPVNHDLWTIFNNVSSVSQPDNYVLTTSTTMQVASPRFLINQSLGLQPPLLVALNGPSVGLLFNAGFEQTLAANLTNASRDMAAGWTGNYTVMQYASNGTGTGPTAAGLPGQSSASQRQYVSLLPGGVGTCSEAALLHTNCSANGLSQFSLPLTLGLQYSLTWQAACGAVGGVNEPCSYAVTATGPFPPIATLSGTFEDAPQISAAFNQTDGTWQPQSLSIVIDPTSQAPANVLITFNPLTGNPLLDSIVLTYASNDSIIDIVIDDVSAIPDDMNWFSGFYNQSLFTAGSDVAFTEFNPNNTAAANTTVYEVVLADGEDVTGLLVHTFPNYTWAAQATDGVVGLQGGRNYTLSVTATALEAAPDGVISLTIFLILRNPATGANAGGSVSNGPPPVCPAGTPPSNCNPVVTPVKPSTRRRLLQLSAPYGEQFANTAYYSCSVPGFPCNNSVLSVTLNVPDSVLFSFDSTLQVVVYGMDVVLTNLQLTSHADLFAFSIAEQSHPSGAKGDPQFTGLRGQRFQVHGVSGTVYNLITDSALQVNARFDFLASGSGSRTDVVATQPWTHPGTYMGAMSFQVRRGGNSSHVDVVVVEAGGPEEGFASVSINGQRVTHPHTWQSESSSELSVSDSATLTVQFVHSHVLELHTRQFHFRLVSSDRFINHEVAPTVPLHALHCHGLLGQTRLDRRYSTALRYVEGSVDDYAVAVAKDGTALLGSDFEYDLFIPHGKQS